MKKLISAAAGTIASLSLALPAFAQNVNPCPTDLSGNFCNLSADDFGPVIGKIIQVLVVVAVIIAVAFLIWGGIKWIMSGGDKAKVESARSTIIGGIVGLVLVFLAYFIVSVIANLFGVDIANIELPQF